MIRASKKLPGVAAAGSGPKSSPTAEVTPLTAKANAVPVLGLLGDGGSDCNYGKLLFKSSAWQSNKY